MPALPTPPNDLVRLIDDAYAAGQETGFRAHLGASLIGGPCDRALWYAFRWCSAAVFSGRTLRLFDRGKREEAVFVDLLRRVGCEVHDGEDGEQFTVNACGGHFGGSMDAVALGIPEAPKTWHVCEFKTHSAKSFRDLEGKGVEVSKPEHFAQMQVYMHLGNLTRALYLAVSKDDDALYAERVPHDGAKALRLLARAESVIRAPAPPSRLSEDPAWWQCKFCRSRAVCHGEALPPVTCRSCVHATPELDGERRWSCAAWRSPEVPEETQRAGCERHCYLPDLVPAVPVDSTDSGVVYADEQGRRFEQGPGGVTSAELARIDPAVIAFAGGLVGWVLENFPGAEVVG